MKQLAIVAFILGVCATSVHAEDQKPVIFNGMVFDSPPTQGAEAPQATPRAKTSHQAKKRTNHKHSAS